MGDCSTTLWLTPTSIKQPLKILSGSFICICSQYYRPGALLRDTELLDVAQRLMEGVEAVPLNLPLNSSLFDTWTQQPLLMSGMWTPPLRATALQQSVSTGVEVGEVVEDRESLSDARSVVSFPGSGIEQVRFKILYL